MCLFLSLYSDTRLLSFQDPVENIFTLWSSDHEILYCVFSVLKGRKIIRHDKHFFDTKLGDRIIINLSDDPFFKLISVFPL